MIPVCLTIAGSDPSGGAGIQADLKVFHQHKVYGESVITLLTVQNTCGVERVKVLEAEFVQAQLRAVINDIPPSAAKTGALGNIEVIEMLANEAADFTFPLVVDPVMISKHGAALLSPDAVGALRLKLLPRAFLVTPNTMEAAALAEMEVTNLEQMRIAADRILELGPKHVLIKGGHLKGECLDLLKNAEQQVVFKSQRIDTPHTHGTGCSLSAAIAARLARGDALEGAVRKAKEFITMAISSSPLLGSGCGPTNLFAKIER